MSQAALLIIVSIIVLALVPIVPQMMSLRIGVLNAIGLRGLAAWHDRNRTVLIPVVRIILAVLAVTLFLIGLYS
ncbi:MAG TPA: hypothetical protein PLF13_01245 [candidate division Zixibacteria bacterium]|nr:hypothetical protein [candidate division Zixibacteria bacterium]